MAARVAEGDSAAFRQIVEHTKVPLYRLALRMMSDPGYAEDALQESYVKAYRALRAGSYDGKSSLSTWLHRITANACIDLLRKRREISSDKAPEPRFDGAVQADARVALREVDAWLSELSPAQRAVVVLKFVEGRSTPEVAEILGCTASAVEQRLVRARAMLRARRDGQE